MRRATVLITGLALLAAPALAQAKTGVIYQKDPEQAKVGEKIHFTVVVFREPRNPNGQAGPVVGRRPLVTFRSKSGRVIRVRSSRTDLNGNGYGDIAFTDKGPWTSTLRLSGVHMFSEPSVPLSVGIGLVQAIPAANASHEPRTAASSDTAGFPWLWVLSLGAIGSALLVFVMRRRGHWGAT
jgi:hypothetical protein